MPREVKLPPIELSPEEIARHLFRDDKSIAESWKMRYKNAESPPVLEADERSVAPPFGREERDS